MGATSQTENLVGLGNTSFDLNLYAQASPRRRLDLQQTEILRVTRWELRGRRFPVMAWRHL